MFQASNPAAFEPAEPEATWQPNKNLLWTGAPVAIGTDKQVGTAQLTVLGNIVSTGTHTRPSDRRVKENIINGRVKTKKMKIKVFIFRLILKLLWIVSLK